MAMINCPSFVTLLLFLTITMIACGENLRKTDAKPCGIELDMCFDNKDCCSSICEGSVKSLHKRCRAEIKSNMKTVGKQNLESSSASHLKILSTVKRQSTPQCLDNLEVCTNDNDCCDDLTCDRSLSSLGSRCRHTTQAYARRKIDEVCKRNLGVCSSDSECCQDLMCDTSLPNLGYRCRTNPKKATITSTSTAQNNIPSFLSVKPKEKALCMEHLSICTTDAECCDEMLCDSSLSSSLGNRCRYVSPVNKGVHSTLVTLKCRKPFVKCVYDDDCCGNDVKCIRTTDKNEKHCHEPSEDRTSTISSSTTNIVPTKIKNTKNLLQHDTNNGMCLSWRQDCTSNQSGCCEGLTCSTFNKNDLNMQCHFVSYEVKIKY